MKMTSSQNLKAAIFLTLSPLLLYGVAFIIDALPLPERVGFVLSVAVGALFGLGILWFFREASRVAAKRHGELEE